MGLKFEKLVKIPLNASPFLLLCWWVTVSLPETLHDGCLDIIEGFKKKLGVVKPFLGVRNGSQLRKIGKNTPKRLSFLALMLVGQDVPD